MNLRLDVDEGILLQATEIEHYGEREDVLEELVLTNKNLIYSYEYKASLVAKAEKRVEKIPLGDIKVVDGKVQIMSINHDDYGDVLQILFIDGTREYFSFWKPKKDIPVWINAINSAILGEETPVVEEVEEQKKRGFLAASKDKIASVVKSENVEPTDDVEKKTTNVNSAASSFAAGFMSMMNSAVQSIDSASKKITEFAENQTNPQYQTSIEAQVQDVVVESPKQSAVEEPKPAGFNFCSNCGQKLQEGSKFCHGCGQKVGEAVDATPSSVPYEEPKASKTERVQEYVGTIMKCPNCGSVIGETTVICPDCGMKITGRSAVGSMQDFKNQLMAIEGKRKKNVMRMLNLAAEPEDLQKLSLVRSFPIPNSIDDIIEFMLLASANIDVALSKNSMMNRYTSSFKVTETSQTIDKSISDAWVSRMQQAYQKAEILFPNDAAFKGIQKVYFDKMAELKIKIK